MSKTKKKPNLDLLVCPECGSDEVSMEAWININTNEYVDDMGSDACQTCESCGETDIKAIPLRRYNFFKNGK